MFGSITGNLLGTGYLLYFQAAGIALSFLLLKKESAAKKILLGSVFGLVFLEWVPVLFAFLFDFTLLSHVLALVCMLPVFVIFLMQGGLGSQLQAAKASLTKTFTHHGFFAGIFLLTFFYFAYILSTHTIVYSADGALYTGQATYGDMSLHLSFITSIAVQQSFPPDYSIFPGVKLAYPFLCDSVSSSLYLLGASLRWAYMLPMLFAFGQILATVYLFSIYLFGRKKKALLTFLLFFLNGGLGFLYFLDYSSDYSISDIFSGYYTMPTNLVGENIRWVNMINDMFLPQRATLFGYAVLFSALFLLCKGLREKSRRCLVLAGLLGGALPLIHTHSFLALGMISAVWLLLWVYGGQTSWEQSVQELEYGKFANPELPREEENCQRTVQNAPLLQVTLRPTLFGLFIFTAIAMSLLQFLYQKGSIGSVGLMQLALLLVGILTLAGLYGLYQHVQQQGIKPFLHTWGLYGLCALVPALPQLIFWTFGQVSEGGFVKGYFNWANLGDPYIWFYVKNIGLVLLLIFLSFAKGGKKLRPLLAPALFVWVIAELVVFTPNVYDNNKLLYVAYFLLCLAVGHVGVEAYEKLSKSILSAQDESSTANRVHPLALRLLAALFLLLCVTSALLSLGREAVSKYQLYGASQVALAQYVEENLPTDAVILTNTHHNNAIACLTGRSIVCGSDSFLYYHGIATSQRKADVAQMFTDPLNAADLFEQYNVSYIVISSYERANYEIDEAIFAQNFTLVFSYDDVLLYQVK